MSSKITSRVFSPLPEGLEMPFHYASLSSLWLWFSADLERVAALVARVPGVRLQTFGGRALVAFNFQRYTSHHDSFLKTTTEVEINTVVAPSGAADPAPSMTLDEWIHGGDAPDHASPKVFCEARARLDGLPWRPAAISPVHKLAVLDGRTVATAWNLLGLSQAALIPDSERDRVTLTAGDARHAMRDDLAALHGSLTPVAVQLFESSPVAVETRGWFLSNDEGGSR